MRITVKQIQEKLVEVLDPELNISIIDLGLVYDVLISKKGKIKIIMTLTSVGCPLFSMIEQNIKDKITVLGVPEKDIEIELTFEPAWTMDRMSKKAKAMLGI